MLARSVTLNIGGQLATLILGFAGTVLLARALGPSDRGLLGLMLSVVQLGMAVGALGLPFAVLFHASRDDPPSRGLLGNSLAYAVLLGAVFVGATWLLTEQVADVFGRGEGGDAWVLAALLVPILFLDFTGHNQLLGQLRFGLFNALMFAARFTVLVGIAVLVVALDLGVTGGLLATAAGSVLMIVGTLRVILRSGTPRLDARLFRSMVSYGTRVQFGTIFQMANQRLDVVILGFFVSLTSVGYYVVAQTIAELVVVLGRSFQTSLLPLIAHHEGRASQRAMTAQSLRHHGLLALVATAANAVVGTLLIMFAFGPSFRDALTPMLILLCGMWFLSTGTVVGGNLRGRGRPGTASLLAGGAVLVTVALDLLLIPAYGINGAAIASVGAYTFYGVASVVALAVVTGIGWRDLVIPTREDLALYPAAARRLAARRPRSRGASSAPAH